MSSSSKTKETFNEFNPLLPMERYSTANLAAFALAAGKNEYDRFEDGLNKLKKRLQEDHVRDNGLDPNRYVGIDPVGLSGQALTDYNNWSAQIGRLHTQLGKLGIYRNALQKYRYDFIMDLHKRGLTRPISTVSQSQSANAGITKQISVDEVDKLFNEKGATAFAEWLRNQSPSGFKVNALEQAARQLKVRGFSTVEGTGDTKKVNLFNKIMAQIGGPMQQGREQAAPVQPGLSQSLGERGIISGSQLAAMKVADLNKLAKQYGVTAGKNKAATINNISSALAQQGVEFRELRPVADIEAEILGLADLARSNPGEARNRASAMDPNELNQVPVASMRKLASALGLGREYSRVLGRPFTGQPSRELIIRVLTGSRTASGLSKESRESVQNDRAYCSQADLSLVQSIAADLRIPTLGLTKEQICDKIYSYHLTRVSELLVRHGADIRKIASLPLTQQGGEVRKLANTIRIAGKIQTLDDLLRAWLLNHYQGRAIMMFPNRQQDVTTFIQTGVLPMDVNAIADLAAIFSDIRRDTYNMNDAQKRQALKSLYDQFINRLQQGGGVDVFLANLNRYGFGTFQQGSPVYLPEVQQQTPVQDNYNVLTGPVVDLRGSQSPRGSVRSTTSGQTSPRNARTPSQVPLPASTMSSPRNGSQSPRGSVRSTTSGQTSPRLMQNAVQDFSPDFDL